MTYDLCGVDGCQLRGGHVERSGTPHRVEQRQARVARKGRHRSWCALWALEPWCSCGGVDVVDLVDWWAAAARPASRDATVRIAG